MAYTLVLHDPSVVALKTIYCAGLTGMLALWVDQRATDRAGVGAGSSPTRTNEETKKGCRAALGRWLRDLLRSFVRFAETRKGRWSRKMAGSRTWISSGFSRIDPCFWLASRPSPSHPERPATQSPPSSITCTRPLRRMPSWLVPSWAWLWGWASRTRTSKAVTHSTSMRASDSGRGGR